MVGGRVPLGGWVWAGQAILSGASLVARRPWTALVSRGRYSEQVGRHDWFAEANTRITAAWTAYFGAAAITTALTASWVAAVWVVPTPALALVSFRVGDRYGAWKSRSRSTTEDPMAASDGQLEIRRQIEGKSDDEILAVADEPAGSLDAVLDMTVDGMQDALDPASAEACVIGYEIATPTGV